MSKESNVISLAQRSATGRCRLRPPSSKPDLAAIERRIVADTMDLYRKTTQRCHTDEYFTRLLERHLELAVSVMASLEMELGVVELTKHADPDALMELANMLRPRENEEMKRYLDAISKLNWRALTDAISSIRRAAIECSVVAEVVEIFEEGGGQAIEHPHGTGLLRYHLEHTMSILRALEVEPGASLLVEYADPEGLLTLVSELPSKDSTPIHAYLHDLSGEDLRFLAGAVQLIMRQRERDRTTRPTVPWQPDTAC